MNNSLIKNLLSSLISRLQRWPLPRKLVLVGILVGISTGIASYVLETAIEWVNRYGLEHFAESPSTLHVLAWLLIPAVGGLVSGILLFIYCPQAQGHGVAEVARAIEQEEGHINSRVAWAKMLATISTIGSGGSTGKEGPIIQIGAALGSSLGRFFKLEVRDLKTIVAAGAVGGLASSFQIPLSGVFFTMEVVLKDFASEAFPAVVISSVAGCIAASLLMSSRHFFLPLRYGSNGITDVVTSAVLGLIVVPIGRVILLTHHAIEDGFHHLRVAAWIKPAIGGLCVGIIGIFVPPVLGMGRGPMNAMLSGHYSIPALIKMSGLKIAAMGLTVGSGGAGGTLMPVFFVGAAAGSAYAQILLKLMPAIKISAGAFAAVGMVGVFSVVFNAPITAMVMALEFTQDYDLIVPSMICCGIAHWVVSHAKSQKQASDILIHERKLS